MDPDFLSHVKYFVFAQEKELSIVIIMCIAISGMLGVFIAYHFRLLTTNFTCNEDYKIDDFKSVISDNIRVVDQIITETQNWKPREDQTQIPALKFDGEIMS